MAWIYFTVPSYPKAHEYRTDSAARLCQYKIDGKWYRTTSENVKLHAKKALREQQQKEKP